MTEVKVTQYLQPYGHKQTMIVVIDGLEEEWTSLFESGCDLAAEVLSTGDVSLTIEDVVGEVDRDIRLCRNGPGVIAAVEELLKARSWERPASDFDEMEE